MSQKYFNEIMKRKGQKAIKKVFYFIPNNFYQIDDNDPIYR